MEGSARCANSKPGRLQGIVDDHEPRDKLGAEPDDVDLREVLRLVQPRYINFIVACNSK